MGTWRGRSRERRSSAWRHVEWKDGAFRAHGFEVGHFYSGRNGMAFVAVDEQLRDGASPASLAEVYDDADVISRVLDGAEESFVELVLAIGKLVSHPIQSVDELQQLPRALVALLKNSPEYLERFQLMTRGEQIRALAKLTTTLLSTYGAAGGTTRTVAATGRGLEAVSVPALTLTADGALAVERVVVPVGRVVTALSGGPGAAIILQRATDAAKRGQPAAPEGPGQWGPANESMSKRAARYQEQISGHSASEAYWVGGKDLKSGGVKLDGFEDGVLLEAKGPGYANKFNDNLTPKKWFEPSGARQLIKQAGRQLKAAKGVPIRWHVAEEKAADAIRKLLKGAGVEGIRGVPHPSAAIRMALWSRRTTSALTGGARKEDAQECARRLATLVQLLQTRGSTSSRVGSRAAKSLKQSLTRPLELDIPSLQKYIQRNLMRDDRRQPMEDLGFSISLWNGAQGGNDALLSIGCGGYSERVGNRCVLDAPNEGPGLERVLTTPFQVASIAGPRHRVGSGLGRGHLHRLP